MKINGIPYLFNSSGILKVNGVVKITGKYYLADENGIPVKTPGWILKNGSWYYVQSDGSLYQGILEDGGYTYYMNPRMVTNSEREVIGDRIYNIDANGHATTATDGVYRKEWHRMVFIIVDY